MEPFDIEKAWNIVASRTGTDKLDPTSIEYDTRKTIFVWGLIYMHEFYRKTPLTFNFDDMELFLNIGIQLIAFLEKDVKYQSKKD